MQEILQNDDLGDCGRGCVAGCGVGAAGVAKNLLNASNFISCNTGDVLSVRNVLTLSCVLGVIAVTGPAVAIAAGPSAGDQQYVDPLGGSGGSHNHTTTTTATPTPAPTSTPAPVASASTSAPTTTATSTTPTATAATGSNTLPFTGLNVGLAAGVGVLLLVAGAGIRQVARRRA